MERLTVKYGDGLYESINPVDICDNDYSKTNYNELVKLLGEYENLEEQGKLLKLPCAVGDRVHHLCALKNGQSEIIEMKVCCVEPFGAIRKHKGICKIWNVYAETDYTKGYFKFLDFGKTVFLTQEEAEAASKELLKTVE